MPSHTGAIKTEAPAAGSHRSRHRDIIAISPHPEGCQFAEGRWTRAFCVLAYMRLYSVPSANFTSSSGLKTPSSFFAGLF
jgi:hypothetical protein